MYNNHFEAKLKKHAGYLFGKEKELPAGHRERFEQRLHEFSLLQMSNDDIPDTELSRTVPSNSNDVVTTSLRGTKQSGKERWIASSYRVTDDKSRFRHCEPAKQSSDKQNIILPSGLLHSVRNDARHILSFPAVWWHTIPIRKKKWLVTTIAVAAVFIGFIFLLNPFAAKQQSTTLTDVRNYYSMLLEEEALTTLLLIQQVDEVNREILLANVDLIENDPLPEVQITDEDYIILIADFYSTKIESLQNMQNIIMTNTLNNN